ncbi:MAG TPA: non-canonical purine NTP pyrophosphatase [Baekduia sp.]|nr:non-canonical purine NTP pyrophosphatase [Baekduia sp.]
MKLVLASRNVHKATELEQLLSPHLVRPLSDEIVLPPETGTTFRENALIKARAAALAITDDSLVVGDDSGIEAAALGGRPGVYSARFAGPDASDGENLAKLLAEAPAGSALAYVCVLALIDPRSGEEQLFEGRCTGVLAATPRGSGGFGYDPAFVPDDYEDGRTMAELSPPEKHSISHRGRAAKALLAALG